MLKTLLAVTLGLGFLILDSHAKPTVAFLGLSRDSDPQISEAIAKRIQWELAADTGVSATPREDIAILFAKGVLREPEVGPLDMPRLAKGAGGRPGAEYYAFGRLEPISFSSKRVWWKPWSVKVKWTQGLRLRILIGANGETVFDGVVIGEVADKALFMGPEEWGRMPPLEREAWLRKMAAVVSVESAKMVSKVVKERTAAPTAAPAGDTEPAPTGG